VADTLDRARFQVAATSFLALFSIVGFALYGLPFYYDFMVKEFGWSRADVTSGNFYSKLLIGPAFGFLAGWMIDRFGPRRLMLAGILMAGMAVFGLGSISTLTMFYFFYMFNALGYVCGGPLPNQVLISRWFNESRGKAMGFAYMGIGIGGAIVPQISTLVESQFGWHTALKTIGVLMILIAFPLAFLVKEAPPQASNLQREAQTAPIGAVFKSYPFYLLLIGSMCSIGAVGATHQHLKLYMSIDLKYVQQEAANILSLILLSSTAGRLLMGWLADRYTKKYVMLLIYTLVAASIPLLFFASNPLVLYLFAILFGIGLGGDYMIIPLMAAELFGVKVLGRLMGVVLTADGVMEALVPLVVGKIYDQTKTYEIAFAALIGLALIGAAAVAFLPKRKVETNASTPQVLETEKV
jgi:MFS family permease